MLVYTPRQPYRVQFPVRGFGSETFDAEAVDFLADAQNAFLNAVRGTSLAILVK